MSVYKQPPFGLLCAYFVFGAVVIQPNSIPVMNGSNA